MSKVLRFPLPLSTELHRLALAEGNAARRGDLWSYLQTRVRWCELVLLSSPALVSDAPRLLNRVQHLLPPNSGQLPRWKRELLARPLVPVVRRILTTHKLPSGALSHGAIERLACGHTREIILLFDADLRARRRRCKHCGEARMAAMDLRDARAEKGAAKHGNRRLNSGTAS